MLDFALRQLRGRAGRAVSPAGVLVSTADSVVLAGVTAPWHAVTGTTERNIPAGYATFRHSPVGSGSTITAATAPLPAEE